MEKTTVPRSLLDLGFEDGIEAVGEPSELQMSSRVTDYQLRFVLGRSYVACVQHASSRAAAVTAGKLAARFGVNLGDLVEVMGLPEELRRLTQETYAENRSRL